MLGPRKRQGKKEVNPFSLCTGGPIVCEVFRSQPRGHHVFYVSVLPYDRNLSLLSSGLRTTMVNGFIHLDRFNDVRKLEVKIDILCDM